MVSTRRAIIALLPDRIDLISQDRSQLIATRRIPITAEHDPRNWAEALKQSGPALRTAVEQLKLVGCPALVLYRSPSQVVNLTSLPLNRSSQALEAAKLSCTDALSQSALSAVCHAAVLGRDQSGASRKTHVVVAAERADLVDAIAKLVDDAGLVFESATPLDAAVVAKLITKALAGQDTPVGWLYVGEHSSFFAIANAGTLMFSRRIDLGLAPLVSALMRPIHLPRSSAPIELDHPTAQQILQQHGIPAADQIVDEAHQLTGAQIVPLIGPSLQRCIVELRQSLRFGINESDRLITDNGNLRICLTGPGAAIGGLAKLLSEELAVETFSDPDYSSCQWSEPAAPGSELADAVATPKLLTQINMMPPDMAQRRGAARLKRWLWAGAAAALLFVAADATRYHRRLTEARRVAVAESTRIAESAQLDATSRKLRALIDAADQLEGAIDTEIGRRVDYRACLHELSRMARDSIRLTTLSLGRTAEHTAGKIGGYAFYADSSTDRTDLMAFIESLQSSPLFHDVVLGSVQVRTIRSAKVEQFEVAFIAVALPQPSQDTPSLAAVEPEASQ